MTAATLTFIMSAFVTFFTIIDPVGLAPVVVALTAHLSEAQRKLIITRATLISAGIIAFFALVLALFCPTLARGTKQFKSWVWKFPPPIALGAIEHRHF